MWEMRRGSASSVAVPHPPPFLPPGTCPHSHRFCAVMYNFSHPLTNESLYPPPVFISTLSHHLLSAVMSTDWQEEMKDLVSLLSCKALSHKNISQWWSRNGKMFSFSFAKRGLKWEIYINILHIFTQVCVYDILSLDYCLAMMTLVSHFSENIYERRKYCFFFF